MTPRQLAMMDRASQLAVFAARQAVGDAGDVLDRASPMRSGVLFSAALGYEHDRGRLPAHVRRGRAARASASGAARHAECAGEPDLHGSEDPGPVLQYRLGLRLGHACDRHRLPDDPQRHARGRRHRWLRGTAHAGLHAQLGRAARRREGHLPAVLEEPQRPCDGRRRCGGWCWRTWTGPGRAAPGSMASLSDSE